MHGCVCVFMNACGIVRECVQFWVCTNVHVCMHEYARKSPACKCMWMCVYVWLHETVPSRASAFKCECLRVCVQVWVGLSVSVFKWVSASVNVWECVFEGECDQVWVSFSVCLFVCMYGCACMLYGVQGIPILTGNTIVGKIWVQNCSKLKKLKFQVR